MAFPKADLQHYVGTAMLAPAWIVLSGARRPFCNRVTKLSGLPVSTVHRFLVNSKRRAFWIAASAGNTISVSLASRSGRRALGQLDIRRLSLPYLQALNNTRAKPFT